MSTTTGISSATHGPNQPCGRTTCAALSPHLGGAHLDPASEHYNGPDIMLRALPYKVRDKAFALLHASRKDGWNRQLVDMALDAMGNEIDRLRQQVAHVRVDADRKVREGSRQALDCEHHGKTIQQLEDQVHHFDRAQDRADRGRHALLGGIQAFDDFVAAVDTKRKAGEPLPDMAQVVEAMRTTLKKVHAAHTRAWSK